MEHLDEVCLGVMGLTRDKPGAPTCLPTIADLVELLFNMLWETLVPHDLITNLALDLKLALSSDP